MIYLFSNSEYLLESLAIRKLTKIIIKNIVKNVKGMNYNLSQSS